MSSELTSEGIFCAQCKVGYECSFSNLYLYTPIRYLCHSDILSIPTALNTVTEWFGETSLMRKFSIHFCTLQRVGQCCNQTVKFYASYMQVHFKIKVSKKSRCWSFVSEDDGNIYTLHYKLGVIDFKCECCYPDNIHTLSSMSLTQKKAEALHHWRTWSPGCLTIHLFLYFILS